jgi:hypothetical protein
VTASSLKTQRDRKQVHEARIALSSHDARNHSNEPRQCARTACLDREGSGKTRRSPIKEGFSAFIEKHPVIFCVVLAFFFIVLWNAVEEYSRACRKEWGSKWENNTKITVYEFNGPFCAFVRWILQ